MANSPLELRVKVCQFNCTVHVWVSILSHNDQRNENSSMLSNMIVRVERRSIHWRQRDALSSVTGSTRIPDNPDRTDTRISTIVTALLKSVCHPSSNDNQVLTLY